MYFIKDIGKDIVVAKLSKKEYVIQWLQMRAGRRSFEELLNVTGADKILRSDAPRGSYRYIQMVTPDGEPVSVCRPRPDAYRLRQFQVLDEFGRSMDPREWDTPVPVSVKMFMSPVFSTGSRRRWHREGGPAMHRRTLRYAASQLTVSELAEMGLPASFVSSSGVRRKLTMPYVDVWNFAEEKYARKCGSSKCWKDQHKTRRRWGKHKGGLCTLQSQPTESGEDLLIRLADEGFPVGATA